MPYAPLYSLVKGTRAAIAIGTLRCEKDAVDHVGRTSLISSR